MIALCPACGLLYPHATAEDAASPNPRDRACSKECYEQMLAAVDYSAVQTARWKAAREKRLLQLQAAKIGAEVFAIVLPQCANHFQNRARDLEASATVGDAT